MRSDLNSFILEVQTLEVAFIPDPNTNRPVLDLSSFSQHTSTYSQKIIQLRQLALSEILLLSKEQIQLQANRLKYVQDKLSRFWKFYSKSLKELRSGELQFDYFMDGLGSYLNCFVAKVDAYGYHERFMNDLHDAVMYKQGEVKYLLHEIKTMVNVSPKSYTPEQEQVNQEAIKRGEVSYCYDNVDILPFYRALNDTYIVDSKLSDFESVFSQRPLSTVKPLRWKSGNASELLYFLTALMGKGLIENEERMSYKRLIACFVKPDGDAFADMKLRSLKSKLDDDFSLKKKEEIDSLLSQFV